MTSVQPIAKLGYITKKPKYLNKIILDFNALFEVYSKESNNTISDLGEVYELVQFLKKYPTNEVAQQRGIYKLASRYEELAQKDTTKTSQLIQKKINGNLGYILKIKEKVQ